MESQSEIPRRVHACRRCTCDRSRHWSLEDPRSRAVQGNAS